MQMLHLSKQKRKVILLLINSNSPLFDLNFQKVEVISKNDNEINVKSNRNANVKANRNDKMLFETFQKYLIKIIIETQKYLLKITFFIRLENIYV